MSIWLGNKKLAGSIVKYSHNIGDIFYTSRTDTILAGAVECNGATYQTTDYTGNESIGALLASGKVPYISLSQYASDLAAHGSVRAFGWDGGNSTSFRVPTLSNVFLEAGQAASAGEYISAGLPNITGDVGKNTGIGHVANVSYGVSVKGSETSGAFFPNLGCNYTATQQTQQGSDGKSLGFDASRSSSIYGNSSTVQPNSVKYRAMVQLANGATDEALMTCENVESDVESLKATLNNKITNCITEIPQDISVTITNGHLIVNAGSKVYFPNGSGTFDVFTLPSSIDSGDVSSITSDYLFFINNSKTGISGAPVAIVYSGTTAPANPSTGTIWYDTTNNSVKRWSGSAWDGGFSLPVVILSAGAVLHQVFNGFGYIGSTVFALPGVKGLIPNGFNDDGSLKNTAFEVTSVISETDSSNFTDHIFVATDGSTVSRFGYISFNYNQYTNKNEIAGSAVSQCIFASVYRISGKVEKLDSATVFHALDYNDSDYIAHQAMPSSRYINLTLGAAGTQYTAPADGYVFLEGNTTNLNGYILLGGSSCDTTSSSHAYNSGYYISATIPVRKGMSFGVWYLNLTAGRFRFVYANGAQ